MRRTLELTVIDPLGIHARPASALALAIKRSGATMRMRFGEKLADGTSVVQMLGLGARAGSTVTIELDGDPAALDTAESALSELFDLSSRA